MVQLGSRSKIVIDRQGWSSVVNGGQRRPKIEKKGQGWSREVRNGQGWSRMVNDEEGLSKMVKDGQRCSEILMSRILIKTQGCSLMVQLGSRTVKVAQIWSRIVGKAGQG